MNPTEVTNPPPTAAPAAPAAAALPVTLAKPVLKPATSGQFRLFCVIVFFSVLSYVFMSHFVLMAVEVRGASMSPTLLDGQRYILLRYAYLWRAPRLGEIVVIEDPEDHGLSVKRIIARPHDLVEIRKDGVYVNGGKLAEPYLTSFAARASGDEEIKPTRLGDNEFFVLGDNRGRSADSRRYGPVTRKAILGLIARSEG